MVAHTVSLIAASPYWKDSAIIITWDDSEGYWDHVPPPVFQQCPDAAPCGDGARVPAIVISPFAKSGAIVHEMDDTASVPKFVETVFGLPAMSSLPDEKPYLPRGPRDGSSRIGNLSGAFDVARLRGTTAPLSSAGALVDDRIVRSIPSPWNCTSIGLTPVPPPAGVSDAPPAGWKARP
jgi:phospholipase C